MRTLALSLILAALMLATPAEAHKVIASVFASGTAIEGEIGFSNGDAPADQLIEVFDDAGTKIGETTTDGDGFFVFTPTQPVTHVFRANFGAGHVVETTMAAGDVAAIIAKAGPATADAGSEQAAPVQVSATEPASAPPQAVTVASLSDAERTAIEKAVRDEIRPLRREIAAYKEKTNLQSVLGGIGYILGLFGIGFYVAARRKQGS
ncbi:MAG: cobalt ABC transporter permease [Hyphomicrobiales bacterium]|nr:MAG: cobalt ABC transporter permease [Hyphomicrobiales bacterium]